jgi:hypothetical protein
MEKVAVIAPQLVAGFPWFKIALLSKRGFYHDLGRKE